MKESRNQEKGEDYVEQSYPCQVLELTTSSACLSATMSLVQAHTGNCTGKIARVGASEACFDLVSPRC